MSPSSSTTVIQTPASTFEIELHYKVLSPEQLPAFIEELPFLYTTNQIDLYLDTKEENLVKRGIFIRIRNRKKLDIKFNRACLEDPTLPMQEYCEEHSFELPLHKKDLERFNTTNASIGLYGLPRLDLIEYCKANALIEHRTVDKTRSVYQLEEFTLMIDEVKELGAFLEVEVMAHDTQDLEQKVTRMKKLLASLSLQQMSTGYATLILREKHFEQYLQSRFILEEDRHLVHKNK